MIALVRVLFVVALAATATGCQKPMEDFTSKEWKFQARFPGKPETKQKAGPFGTQMTMFLTESRDGGYIIGVADMPIPADEPQTQIQARLDGARDGAVRNINATLESSNAITLQEKFPGRELTAKLPPQPNGPKDGILRGRIFLVGKRLYQVLIIGTPAYVNSAKSAEFMDSFKVLE